MHIHPDDYSKLLIHGIVINNRLYDSIRVYWQFKGININCSTSRKIEHLCVPPLRAQYTKFSLRN